MNFLKSFLFLLFLFFFNSEGISQTPGQIFQPVSGAGQRILDPNGDGYISASNNGFTTTSIDYGSSSEIPYFNLPVLFSEIKTDVRTGGNHTDLIGIVSGTYKDLGAFVFNDGTNLLFRQRLLDHSTASKGYGFLFDVSGDGKPDYEIVLRTGGGESGITIYSSNGTPIGNRIALNNNFQKSVAAVVNTGASNEQTYFYDFFIPWANMPFTANQQFRGIAYTITSATGGYLSGGTVADIGGLDDQLFPNQDLAILFAMSAQPIISGSNLILGAGGFPVPITSTPTINTPILAGSNVVVTGTSAEQQGTTINIFVYADANSSSSIATSSGTVGANGTWSITMSSLTSGQYLSATATASGKSVSLASDRVRVQANQQADQSAIVVSCTPKPSTFSRSGNTFKGTVPGLEVPTTSSQLIIRLYTVNNDGTKGSLRLSTKTGETSPTVNYKNSSGFVQQTPSGNVDFELEGSGNPFVGNFYVTAQRSGLCESDIGFDGSGTPPAAPVISSSSIAPGTGQTITGTSNAANGSPLTIYKNDDSFLIGSTTVQSGAWTATLTGTVTNNDVIYARVKVSNLFSNQSNTVVVGVDQTQPPVITGQYTSNSTTINGYTQTGGQTVRVFRNGSQIGTVNSNVYGSWTLNLISLNPAVNLAAGNTLTADALAPGETRSNMSNSVTVASSTTVPSAPIVTGPIVAGQATITATGTTGTVHFYADGEPIGQTSTGSSITLSSSDAQLYILKGVKITATNTLGGLVSTSSSPVQVQAGSTPANLSITNTPFNPIAGSSVIVTAIVTDQFGSTLANQSVSFSIVSGNGSFSGTNPITTDAFGVARITYQTSTLVESASIKATVGLINQTTAFQSVAGPENKLAITSIHPTIPIRGVPTSITVQRQDINGNPTSSSSTLNITLSANSNYLTSTLSAVIASGNNSVVISNVRFANSTRTVNNNIVTYPASANVQATANNLTSATSSSFVISDGVIWQPKQSGQWNSIPWRTSSDGKTTWTDVVIGSAPINFGAGEIVDVPAGISLSLNSNVSLHNANVSGVLEVPSNYTLTLNHTADDVTAEGILVEGTLENSGGDFINQDQTKPIKFNGGIYKHARNGGSIPIAIWQSRTDNNTSIISEINVTGISNTAITSGLDQSFQRFIWNNAGQNVAQTLTGNVSVSSLFDASAGTLSIGANTLSIGGILQYGNNGWLSGSSNSSLIINGTGSIRFTTANSGDQIGSFSFDNVGGNLDLNSNLLVQSNMTLTNGTITVANNNRISYKGATAISRTNGYVIGKFERVFPTTTSTPNFLYPIGSAEGYAPVKLTFSAGTIAAGTEIFARTNVNSTQDINQRPNGSGFKANAQLGRYWEVKPQQNLNNVEYGLSFDLPASELSNFTISNIQVRKLSRGNNNKWKTPRNINRSSSGNRSQFEATGYTDFSEFYLGETESASLSVSTISATPFIVSNGVGTSEITVQLKDENGNNTMMDGATVSISSTPGTVSNVRDNLDGTYSATLTSSTSGTHTITGLLNNNAFTNTAVVNLDLQSLPVTWKSFSAKKINQGVEINWSTASEQNTKDFDVQYSTDGIIWNSIGVVTAAGNSNSELRYQLIHSLPKQSNGTVYYRIKQNDLDGKTSYSKVVSVSVENTNSVVVYPNPVNDILIVYVKKEQIAKLISSSGAVIWSSKLYAGRNEIKVSAYLKGTYILQTESGNQRIVIQ